MREKKMKMEDAQSNLSRFKLWNSTGLSNYEANIAKRKEQALNEEMLEIQKEKKRSAELEVNIVSMKGEITQLK